MSAASVCSFQNRYRDFFRLGFVKPENFRNRNFLVFPVIIRRSGRFGKEEDGCSFDFYFSNNSRQKPHNCWFTIILCNGLSCRSCSHLPQGCSQSYFFDAPYISRIYPSYFQILHPSSFSGETVKCVYIIDFSTEISHPFAAKLAKTADCKGAQSAVFYWSMGMVA